MCASRLSHLCRPQRANNRRATGVWSCAQDLLEVIVVPSGPAEDVIQAVRSLVDEYHASVSSPSAQVLLQLWRLQGV